MLIIQPFKSVKLRKLYMQVVMRLKVYSTMCDNLDEVEKNTGGQGNFWTVLIRQLIG